MPTYLVVTHLNWTFNVFFSTVTELCNHHDSVILEHFCHPLKEPGPITRQSPFFSVVLLNIDYSYFLSLSVSPLMIKNPMVFVFVLQAYQNYPKIAFVWMSHTFKQKGFLKNMTQGLCIFKKGWPFCIFVLFICLLQYFSYLLEKMVGGYGDKWWLLFSSLAIFL